MNPLFLTITRHVVAKTILMLPKQMQTRIERRLRGGEDFARLQSADAVIVSFGKSGRTWLRVLLSRFYQVRYGLPESLLLTFDNLNRRNPDAPKIFFTHDNYLKDFTGNTENKAPYYAKRVVLLVRDPADVAVSQYYQWKFRMTARKKRINEYPVDEIPLFDFVMDAGSGLPKVIGFMNAWARDLGRMKNLLVIRYEDMRADTAETLKRILAFIGTPGTADEIAEAVRFASVENMRQLEQKKTFWRAGSRMTAPDTRNPNTFKVRKAKVGGYRDEFTPEQLAAIDDMIASRLIPVFGYERGGPERSPQTQEARVDGQ
ncbi:MAG: sulfotransferase domain-containing protein [Rhodospirillales bacterium]